TFSHHSQSRLSLGLHSEGDFNESHDYHKRATRLFRMEHQAQTLKETDINAADDIRLVSEVLRKDRKATAEFVERYTNCVYSYVRPRVMPHAEAVEDLVQEVFLAAWRSLGNFRGEASLHHWLRGIARHKVEDYYRKRLCEPEVRVEIEE